MREKKAREEKKCSAEPALKNEGYGGMGKSAFTVPPLVYHRFG